jgi:hypothetical protein
MNELFERIIAWHEKNMPDGLPYEALPQIGFLLEELHEVNKELIAGNTDKAVGEICDLIVFSVNAIKLLDGKIETDCRYLEQENNEAKEIIADLLRNISYIAKTTCLTHNDHTITGYCDLIARCVAVIEILLYEPELALLETIKKIESWRGSWDASIGKWVKEKNQTDVYEPDYSLAKKKLK